MSPVFLRSLTRATLALSRALLVMLCVLVLVFLLVRFAPGDPLATMMGDAGTPEALAELRAHYGLDRPLFEQLLTYIWNALHGDFGSSLTFRQPAMDLVIDALPRTLLLGAVSFLLTLVIAVPLGILAALNKGNRIERAINFVVLLFQVIPPFWAGIMLIHVFALRLQLLPTSGYGTWQQLVLPAVTLSLFQVALTVKTLRSAMLEVLREDFIRTARAKGVPRSRIVLRHALRNALAPVITVLAFQLGAIFSGAVVTEAVFSWPGLGSLAMGALLSRDYAVAQAVVVVSSALVIFLNLFADAIISMIDPRARAAGKR